MLNLKKRAKVVYKNVSQGCNYFKWFEKKNQKPFHNIKKNCVFIVLIFIQILSKLGPKTNVLERFLSYLTFNDLFMKYFSLQNAIIHFIRLVFKQKDINNKKFNKKMTLCEFQ